MWAKIKKVLLFFGVSIGVFVGLLFVVAFSFRILSGEFFFTKNFEKVRLGFDESQVLALLGNPDEKGTEFRLGQYKDFEEAYERASKSRAKNYWFWFQDIDIVYTVGFDEHGKVVVAEYGGT